MARRESAFGATRRPRFEQSSQVSDEPDNHTQPEL